jgi:hypothetical protein
MGLAGLTMECRGGALSNRLVERGMEANKESEGVEIQLNLREEDYTRFYWWHVSHRTGMWVALIVSVVVAACFLFAGLRESGAERIGEFVVVGVIVSYWLIILPSSIATSAKQTFATHQAARESHQVVVAAGGVASAAPSSSGQQSWGMFWKAVEAADAFYLHLSSAMAVVLPKRCFTSPEQMQRFREIVRAALGDKARGIKG